MDNGTLVVADHHTDGRRPGLRRASVLVALAVALSLFVLVQRPADAAPKVSASVSAQIDFRQFSCPILQELRDAYADIPFFQSVLPIIDNLLGEFECVGGTTTTVAPTTTTTLPPTTTTIVLPPGGGAFELLCPTLLGLRASFDNSPFFSGFLPVIDFAIGLLGCNISG